MSVRYVAVGWNRQKKIYDSIAGAGMLTYLTLFLLTGSVAFPAATVETLIIRAFGSMALLLLHIILCIGPLCRLERRFLPLLYNRRHLGVAMFFTALVHGVFSLVQFHGFGDTPPLVSLLTSNARFDSLRDFPFELPGLVALLILFLMAATSHDFWLHNLSATVWKALHMMVYLAYGLLIAHVALGEIQAGGGAALPITVGVGLVVVAGLHIIAGVRERNRDQQSSDSDVDGFVAVCDVRDIPEKRAKVISLGSERVAVFRYDGKISAISNVCRHQGGPLGEGKIVDGCVTCPWHGYQYEPESGVSPAPFTDKVATYQTRVLGSRVFVHPCAHPAGTRLQASEIGHS